MNGIKDIHIGVIPVKSSELLLECLETGGAAFESNSFVSSSAAPKRQGPS